MAEATPRRTRPMTPDELLAAAEYEQQRGTLPEAFVDGLAALLAAEERARKAEEAFRILEAIDLTQVEGQWRKRAVAAEADADRRLELLQAWEPRITCPQCGKRYTGEACGPTHAVIAARVAAAVAARPKEAGG